MTFKASLRHGRIYSSWRRMLPSLIDYQSAFMCRHNLYTEFFFTVVQNIRDPAIVQKISWGHIPVILM